jgi:hypothetical protein
MTPINVNVYIAAYAGAISGMTTSGWITDDNPADYALVTAIAGTFAQEFDQIWNNAAPINTLQQTTITALVSENFRGRAPGPLSDPTFLESSNWTVNVSACVAVIHEGDTFFAGQGIVPPLPGEEGNPPPIRIPIGVLSTSSNTQIPANAVVTQVALDIENAYSAEATIAVTCNGQSLFTPNNVNPQAPGLYELPSDTLITNTAVVNIIVGGIPTEGSGFAIITYSLPTN